MCAAGPLPRHSLPQPTGEGAPLSAAGPPPRRSLPQPTGEGAPLSAAGPPPRRSPSQPTGEGIPMRASASARRLDGLLANIRACTLCATDLPLGPRPIVQAHPAARILIVGQAPGTRAHRSGRPFQDPSGNRLRDWLQMPEAVFYDPKRVAIAPMGFCYPGTGAGGDLPPRPECAMAWRAALLAALPRIELTLVIGRYAHDYHLPVAFASVAQAVQAWRSFWPVVVPLPHPSPRNNLWLRRNAWFEQELIPQLRGLVGRLLEQPPGRLEVAAIAPLP